MVRIAHALCLALLLFCAATVQAQGSDIRLIVDISGSMKENDPNNLRRPAVRLITELLPDDSSAGVWTFGRYVNMLVPHGEVSPAWRERARARAPDINSVGLLTNIGGALEVASDDFYQERRRDNVHFILLTDGMVDLAMPDQPDRAETNRAERRRILEEVAPALAAKGARIHTIALSENADFSLLQQLGRITGGSFTLARSDRDLSRAFLSALDRAGATTEVPLEKQRFTIDGRIREFTAVIFHAPDAPAPALKAPDGDEYRPDGEAASEAGKARWLTGTDYSLFTVAEPAGGEWQVLGELGPGSRIKVVTDLEMSVSPLPAYLFPGQETPLNVAFTADGELITDPDFLRFLEVSVEVTTADGRSGRKTLSKAGVPADGVYRDRIDQLAEPGSYTFITRADGRTFQRQNRQTLVIRPPVDIEAEGQGAGADSQYEVRVTLAHPDVDPAKAQIRAEVTGPDSGKAIELLTSEPADGSWRFTLQPDMGEGDYRVHVELEGETESGDVLTYRSPPLVLTLPRQSEAVDYPAAIETESGPSADTGTEKPPELPFGDNPSGADDERGFTIPPSWLWAAGLVALLGLTGAGWWARARKARPEASEDSVEPPVVEEIAAPAAQEVSGPEMNPETDPELVPDEQAAEVEDTDALADRIMADEGDPASELPTVEDEFFLEDLDLADSEERPDEEADGDTEKASRRPGRPGEDR